MHCDGVCGLGCLVVLAFSLVPSPAPCSLARAFPSEIRRVPCLKGDAQRKAISQFFSRCAENRAEDANRLEERRTKSKSRGGRAAEGPALR